MSLVASCDGELRETRALPRNRHPVNHPISRKPVISGVVLSSRVPFIYAVPAKRPTIDHAPPYLVLVAHHQSLVTGIHVHAYIHTYIHMYNARSKEGVAVNFLTRKLKEKDKLIDRSFESIYIYINTYGTLYIRIYILRCRC